MNKRKLIREVARRTGFSIRVSKIIVECLIENISLALKQGDKVALKDFGAFCNIDRQGKRYYDIPTGKIKTFSARKVVKFIPYKKFKEQLRPNLLVHEEDDGSIGTSIKIESRIFFNGIMSLGLA